MAWSARPSDLSRGKPSDNLLVDKVSEVEAERMVYTNWFYPDLGQLLRLPARRAAPST